MSVKKNRKIIQAAVIVAVVAFALSAFAAGVNMTGYERLKTAGFQLVEGMNGTGGSYYSNGTFYLKASLLIDGVEAVRQETITMYDGERELESAATYYNAGAPDMPSFIGGGMDNKIITYSDDGAVYYWYDDDGFRESKFYGRYREDASEDESFITPAQRRLIEAIADALIGETRNYFVLDGNIVSISLSGNQIPEIAQYALAAFAEQAGDNALYGSGANYVAAAEQFIGPDARFTDGFLEVGLDGDNNITGAKLTGALASTVNGRIKTYRVTAEILTKNMGTTVITKPDNSASGKPVIPSFNEEGPLGASYVSGADVS